MSGTLRLALTSAFLAAVVTVGLALSYVPNVELITLVVFAAGVLLGPRDGAMVGAGGMCLYVFANSAVKGFAPSPLPILAAQALGMSLPGAVGGWWRRAWVRCRRRRRLFLLMLPVLGVLLATVNQILLNLSYAFFLGGGGESRMAAFLSGMSFGSVQILVNGVVFAVAGAQTVAMLRRLARSRGWWGAVAVAALVLVPVPSSAQTGADADSLPVEPASGKDADPEPGGLRGWASSPRPLWEPVAVGTASLYGLHGVQELPGWSGGERSRTTARAMAATLDRWALGWGRVRYAYDGFPLQGPVHGMGDPPDLPLAWSGSWRERWSASGTAIDIAPPAPAPGVPQSQVSLTTGSFGRRTAEFSLVRGLGPVNGAVDFLDREEQGALVLGEVDGSRVWVRARSAGKRRPDWSVDISTGRDERNLFSGGRLERDVRRVIGVLRGPLGGGEARLGLHFRREALRLDGISGFGEVRTDGWSAQLDWAGPAPGVRSRVRWMRDRRRGVLSEDQTLDGAGGEIFWSGRSGVWRAGVEAGLGYQEPYGFNKSGHAVLFYEGNAWEARIALAHAEDLPPLVLGIDRPTPETGVVEYHQGFEIAEEPESRTSVRGEVSWTGSRAGVRVGGWGAVIRDYRLDNNPLWVRFSPYAPDPYPGVDANVAGAYGEVFVELVSGVTGRGHARVHSREAGDVPYLARWIADGALHWRRLWFRESLDLELWVGGELVGERESPAGEQFPVSPLGRAGLVARVDNGVFSMVFDNLSSSFLESDLRSDDLVNPLPVAGRTLTVALTLYLLD